MNSRSSVNETNLVNFPTDLATLSPLDSKDGLLSFPFDHIYACHSESSDRRQTLQLDKEVEISTHCVIPDDKELLINANTEISDLTERLVKAENENKKLKDLIIYHLDLIQQQNDLITKREKVYQAIKQENDTLKARVNRADKRLPVSQRQGISTTQIVHVPTPPVTSTVVKSEPGTASQIMLNSFTELLLPDNRSNPYIFDSDLNKTKPFGQEPFDLPRSTETDVSSYLTSDLGVSSILDSNLNCEDYTMIESKRSFIKKDIKTEPRPEPLYTVTSNSGGNPVIQRIQRNRRRTSTLGSLSRMSKNPKVDPEPSKMFEDDKSFDRSFNVNKKSKMINTYGKSRTSTSTTKTPGPFTTSLSDRFQLIDTPPSGEDPYQLGEADLREQSPIPKLMLQKTNHGRMRVCTETGAESTTTSRRIYDTTDDDKLSSRFRYNLPNPYMHPSELKSDSPKTLIVEEPDLDIVKTETEIDWRMYNPNKPGNETSLCDFSYGETTSNLESSMLPSLDSVEFADLFSTDSPLNLDSFTADPDFPPVPADKPANEKSKKRGGRTTSLVGPNLLEEESGEIKRGTDSKRGRKRALSTTGLLKNIKRENAPKPGAPKPKLVKGKAPTRGKKSPLPGMVTKEPYHTLVGDPDLSWYLGLDPDVKLEDVEPSGDTAASTVEVPRWREKPYTSCYTMEGTENLDDKVFEKRHQKLEAEERRQLRWHMRRIREQRHVERLRQRQRDSWCGGGGSPAHAQPAVYTVWPQPQRDVRFIEITDTLPVMAFGEILPALPESDFVLPWVRSSKAMKRSKRSKTLH
ncbi:uncharacterized protein LOC126379793 [Pectinophora gossypiella]|nr:uncharacterized protein LOC126379793 [Pectinophora gossypiella]